MFSSAIEVVLNITCNLARLISAVKQEEFTIEKVLIPRKIGDKDFSHYVMVLKSKNNTELIVKGYQSGGFELITYPKYYYTKEYISLRPIDTKYWEICPIEN